MTFTHALSTNDYGPAKLIVSTNPANGTHTTLTSAMAAATAGDTIFLRNSLTENVTVKPGVNISSFIGSANTPTVLIIGKLTMTGPGTSSISGIWLQTNGDFFLEVSGANASTVNLVNCYLDCANNTGISFTSSNANSQIICDFCAGNLATAGVSLFASSSAGNLFFNQCLFDNFGGSSTASTVSAGKVLAGGTGKFNFPITTSGTGELEFTDILLDASALNVTVLTINGSGGANFSRSSAASGTASAISIGNQLTMTECSITCSNAVAITGTGTLIYSPISFVGSSFIINVATQVPLFFGPAVMVNFNSPLIDLKATGLTYLFNTPFSARFVCVSYTKISVTSMAPNNDSIYNVGWTPAAYNDFINMDSFYFITPGISNLTTETVSPVFPANTPIFLNVTTPDSGTALTGYVSLQGFFIT